MKFNFPYNEDTGDIQNLYGIDSFVIGMSKCGTTTMQLSLKKPVLKYHSDFTLEKVYGTEKLSTKLLLEERKTINRPFYIYVPYREPVARKISQYYFYMTDRGEGTSERLEKIKAFCLGDYSLFNKEDRTEVDEELVYQNIIEATGINILDIPFGSLGYIHEVRGNLNLIPFILDKIQNLGKYIVDYIYPKFVINTKRVTGDGSDFFFVKENIKFTDNELDIVYGSRYCKYFYTEDELDTFKEKYRNE